MQKVCLDAGVLGIHLSRDTTKEVNDLMNAILKKEIQAYLVKSILIESYYHLCKLKGIEIAKIVITSFLKTYPVELISIGEDLIFSAGKLKCQNRKILSYNDCLCIAFCLNNKVEFHTTEENLKNIPDNTLIKYNF
ncbi:MAG: PIN domain-containing protein [Candidatus Lokiarchaeota archaeon]